MERTTKAKEIHAVLNKYNVTTSPLCERHVVSLYDLYINHDESAICKSFLNDGNYLNMIGLYYEHICKNEVKMYKYYEMAVKLGNSNAMNNLGCYYKNKNDIPNMLKYWEMAVALGHSRAMSHLGYYYNEQNDIQNMLKFYKMAVELGNSTAMGNLGCYYYKSKDFPNMLKYWNMAVTLGDSYVMTSLGQYYNEQKDIPNMLKYYEMAVALKYSGAMNNLGCYYDKQKDIPNMLKYWEMAVELGHVTSMNNLGLYYKNQKDIPNMVKYYGMSIEHGNIKALNNYLSEILKDNGEIPYDKNKIEMAIRKVDMKEIPNDNMKLLQKCIKYTIHVQDETLFFHLYETYKTAKPFETFHLFYMARLPLIKIETCLLCMEEKKEIIPFDCIWHGYCVMCTFQLKECGICKIAKHPYFAKMFDA